MAANLAINFSSTAAVQPYRHFSRGHIDIRDLGFEAAADAALLAAIGPVWARPFVRLDQWAENPYPENALDTDPNPAFTLGDSWLAIYNARGTKVWVTHEDLLLTQVDGSVIPSWIGLNNGTGFTTTNLNKYEDLLFAIYRHIKTQCPNFLIAESLNEPALALNGSFQPAQIYELMKRCINAVKRVNALGLPGAPIKAAGPSMTKADTADSRMEQVIDAIAADSVNWFANYKPHFAYWTLHNFGHSSDIDALIDSSSNTDGHSRCDALFAACAVPTIMAGIPRAISAYSLQGGEINTADPTAMDMVRNAAFYAANHCAAQWYISPTGDKCEEIIMFCKSNYREYACSMIRPFELPSKHTISWGGTAGSRTPVYNVAAMEQMVADGTTEGVLVNVVGSGADSWEVLGPDSKNGVIANAVYRPGVGKAWIIAARNLLTSDNSGNPITLSITNLAAAGIDTSRPIKYNEWRIDNNTSNIGASVAGQALTKVANNVSLPSSGTQSIVISMKSPSIHLVEISGTALDPTGDTTTTTKSGTTTPSGTLTRQATRRITPSGSVAPTSTLTKVGTFQRTLTGLIGPSGQAIGTPDRGESGPPIGSGRIINDDEANTLAMEFVFAPPADDVAATYPIFWWEPANAQTGNLKKSSGLTFRRGTTTGSDSSDPTYNAGPPAYEAFDGSDDQLSILGASPLPLAQATDEFTLLIVHRRASNPAGLRVLASSRGSGATSRGLRCSIASDGTITWQVSDGTSQAGVSGTAPATGIKVCSWIYSKTVTDIEFRQNGTTGTSIARTGNTEHGTVASGAIWRLGAYLHTNSTYFTGDILAFLGWQRQLTGTEMTDVETHFGAGS